MSYFQDFLSKKIPFEHETETEKKSRKIESLKVKYQRKIDDLTEQIGQLKMEKSEGENNG